MAQARRPRGGCAFQKTHRRFVSTLGNECARYLSPRRRDRMRRHQIATEPEPGFLHRIATEPERDVSETSFGSRSGRNLQQAIVLVREDIVLRAMIAEHPFGSGSRG